MKKNGFTLIELLAVIVILAIIALIAVPIILNIINTAREESNKRSIELYASSVRNTIAAYQLTNPKPPKTFSDLTVEYKGDVECSIKELYSDGSFYLEGCRVNKSENEYSYGVKQGSNKACTLEDLDGDGKASLSDIVTCGTESFYVMTNENNEITMLSMYNLDVGYVLTYDENWSITLTPIENPTNKQNEIAIGYYPCEEDEWNECVEYGLVAFSSENYWDPNYEPEDKDYPMWVYDENSNLYQYISEYERILKEEMKVSSAKTSLISHKQLIGLGCDEEKRTCGPDVGHGALENPAPEWVYSTSYWTGSVGSSSSVWSVYSFGVFNDYYYDYADDFGVRAVVTISSSEI